MEQIAIAFTGVVAIWLTQQSNEGWKRYACLFGMAGQPFWFYSAYMSEQWGILLLTFFYTYAWFLGLRNNWLTKPSVTIDTEQYSPSEREFDKSLDDHINRFIK